jgi:isopentenyl-diphosphate Delta-isomerase
MDELNQQTYNRKQDHIKINLQKDVQSSLSAGFEFYHLEHNPLPEIDMAQIDTHVNLLGKELRFPLMLSSMTGGTADALKINISLATAAEARGIAMGLGSGRPGLESAETAKTYNLRKWAPSVPIYANLGAIQLNYGCGLDECKRVVEMAQADALILHLNTLQEALQPEGQTNFSGLARKIETICSGIGVPVIAKEVGWGINARSAKRLADLGIACIDIAGAGGTSWSEVEKHRNKSEERIRISSHFRDWGTPTAFAVEEVCRALPNIPVIASGGLRTGLDLAKSLVLGATVGGMAGGFLKAATQSDEAVLAMMDEISLELRIVMFTVGAANIREVKNIHISKSVRDRW